MEKGSVKKSTTNLKRVIFPYKNVQWIRINVKVSQFRMADFKIKWTNTFKKIHLIKTILLTGISWKAIFFEKTIINIHNVLLFSKQKLKWNIYKALLLHL